MVVVTVIVVPADNTHFAGLLDEIFITNKQLSARVWVSFLPSSTPSGRYASSQYSHCSQSVFSQIALPLKLLSLNLGPPN